VPITETISTKTEQNDGCEAPTATAVVDKMTKSKPIAKSWVSKTKKLDTEISTEEECDVEEGWVG
jgi:hypothetical protein